MTNVVLAFDSFKDSISSNELCDIFEKELIELYDVNIIKKPIADGGEGFVSSIYNSNPSQFIINEFEVTSSVNERIITKYLLSLDEKTAIFEMATIAGLEITPKEKRNPLYTTCFGIGELLRKFLDLGIEHTIIGIGGSATNEGGLSVLQGLGIELFDTLNHRIVQPIDGSSLNKVHKIIIPDELRQRMQSMHITFACDVENPYIGPHGAAFTYAKQKGANENEINTLENNMIHSNELIFDHFGVDLSKVKGTGAAGGIAGPLYAIFNAELKSGIKIVLEFTKLREVLKIANLLITGEGKVDNQTKNGKAISVIEKECEEMGVPIIIVCGMCDLEQKKDNIVALIDHFPLSECMNNTKECLSVLINQHIRILMPKNISLKD
eukprot:TRINITY_DN1770_c0_g1_i1.p1 TRINITY_DN1770_c0_g1~~TRINITY_DN1770_c0_g1_i1.p1  ORF type:complete len:392 (+),score=126.38 TRINITY_DN1770_c0_g1_i1:35-1177(+)